jgi:hypothetical protein
MNASYSFSKKVIIPVLHAAAVANCTVRSSWRNEHAGLALPEIQGRAAEEMERGRRRR